MSNVVEQKTQSIQASNQASITEMFQVANALAQSTIIPQQYQNSPANCFVALEVASRMNASPFMVMQNLHIIQGKPSWSSSFIISAINTSGRFKTPLQFKLTGSGDNLECFAYATSKDGTICEGPVVSMKMAKAEGWFGKNGSKWQTMPELMIRYRAASFFGRLYTPEVLMGMQSVEEIIDVDPIDISNFSPEEEVRINANTGEVMDFEEPVAETKKETVKKAEPKQETIQFDESQGNKRPF